MKNQNLDSRWNSLNDYNNSVTLPSDIVTGKEFRRMKRKNKC